jgi:hypothetical protein
MTLQKRDQHVSEQISVLIGRIMAYSQHEILTNLTQISERIAISIVRVDVRYPGGIVGIVLQYDSSNRIYLCIGTMSFEI